MPQSFLLSVFSLIFISFFASIAEAQTSCLKYLSGSTVPTGYGAAWDVFDSQKRLLVSSNCPADGKNVTLTIGRGDSTQYIWSVGYVYHDGEWSSKELEGDGEKTNGWFTGKASAAPFTPPTSISTQNPLFMVGYVCTNRSGAWKCGCRDTGCSQQFWQLQAYTGIPSTSGGGSTGGNSQPPTNYTKSVFKATPLDSDSSFDAFTSRVGMSKRWRDEAGATYPYELATIGGARAIKITARKGTKGANAGFLFDSIPGVGATGVNGGPHDAFGRVKVWWPTGYNFNPAGPNGDFDPQYGGTKMAGFWGGGTPATADDANNDGWALTIWTGRSSNYVSLGLDLNAPRDGSFAGIEVYKNGGNLFEIYKNQGRWVQLEWELDIEDSAGGMGRVRFWIDGKLGIDKAVRYFSANDWTPQTGVKGIYLRNFYGGSGRAPQDQPVYYKDIELWGK